MDCNDRIDGTDTDLKSGLDQRTTARANSKSNDLPKTIYRQLKNLNKSTCWKIENKLNHPLVG